MKGYYQKVTCPNCGHKREIHRRHGTPKDHTYYCDGCHKDVKPKEVQ